jgi:hypothetical protein
MGRGVVIDQLERFARHVAPVLRERAAAIESAPPSRIELTEAGLSAIEGHQATTRESTATSRR